MIWESSHEEVSRALTTLGYMFQKVRHPDEHIGFWCHEQYVSFTLNMRNELGRVETCGR